MRLSIHKERLAYLESRMEELAPWMHQFRFSNNALVGYYKFAGLDWNDTWCNRESDQDRISKMVNAYESIEHGAFKTFLGSVFDSLNLPDRNTTTAIDISSATGKNSFYTVDHGFGRVIASEIRQNSSDQHKLILECTDNSAYQEKIESINDPVSADAPEFPDRYHDYKPDVVMSIGLLYHMANPVQHLMNLHAMTNRYVILHTMTHDIRGAETTWRLLVEGKDTITKATSGISWTPHFFGLTKLFQEIGFKNCEIHYPDLFSRNHPNYKEGYVPTGGRVRDHILSKFGINTQAVIERQKYLSNFDPACYEKLDIMPGSFFYVLEK